LHNIKIYVSRVKCSVYPEALQLCGGEVLDAQCRLVANEQEAEDSWWACEEGQMLQEKVCICLSSSTMYMERSIDSDRLIHD